MAFDDQKAVQLISLVCKDIVQAIDDDHQFRVGTEPKKDDPLPSCHAAPLFCTHGSA
jgi:hypothetical protein